MTERTPNAVDEQDVSRAFYDVVRLLESATDPDRRVVRVLTRLRSLVAYDGCAVLDVSPGGPQRLLTCSESSAVERARLLAMMAPLLRSIESDGHVSNVYSTATGQLAIPLVSLDTVVGLLFVERALSSYDERHVEVLSVFAAQLGAYFSMQQARARELALTHQLEEAKQKGAAASRAKEDLVARVSPSTARGSRPAMPAGSREAGRALSGIHVLLVDDDRDICEVLQFVLEGQGAVVTVATSAAAALLALDRSRPHVLLSDIAMPGETGHDLMREILAREGAGAPPAAALSAYARAQDRQMATASGFQMLLEKPVDQVALIAAVAVLAEAPIRVTPAPLAGQRPSWTS